MFVVVVDAVKDVGDGVRFGVREDKAGAFFRGNGGVFDVKDGVCEAACSSDDRKGSVAHGDHLCKAAGFEERGDDDCIGGGVDLPCKGFIKGEIDVKAFCVFILISNLFKFLC